MCEAAPLRVSNILFYKTFVSLRETHMDHMDG